MNLLDLNNDILNIIGGYVKKDNKRRIRKENDFEKTDFIMNRLKENNKFNKYEINEAIYSQLFKNCCTEEEIKEYVETRNLTNYFIVDDIGKNSIKLFKIIKKSGWNDDKPSMRHLIVNYLYVNNIRDIETIHHCLTLMKLNLKRKKYTFSTFCIENLEVCKKIYDKILIKKTLDFKKVCLLCII